MAHRRLHVVRHSRRRTRRGALLLEALVAGLILAIGLAVLVSTSTQALTRQKIGEEQIIAASLLNELLNMVLVEGPEEFSKLHEMDGHFYPPFERFEYEIEITHRGESLPYAVSATVMWPSGGRIRSATIDTFIAQKRGDTEVDELREPGEPIIR